MTVAAILCAMTACGPSAWDNAKSEADLRQRAAFEMKCDGNSLKLVALTYSSIEKDFATQYGVEGCGQRLVYVHADFHTGWVVDTHADHPSNSTEAK